MTHDIDIVVAWLRDQLAGVHPIAFDSIVAIASANTLVGHYPH